MIWSRVFSFELGFYIVFVDLEIKTRIYSFLENIFFFKEEFFVFILNSFGW